MNFKVKLWIVGHCFMRIVPFTKRICTNHFNMITQIQLSQFNYSNKLRILKWSKVLLYKIFSSKFSLNLISTCSASSVLLRCFWIIMLFTETKFHLFSVLYFEHPSLLTIWIRIKFHTEWMCVLAWCSVQFYLPSNSIQFVCTVFCALICCQSHGIHFDRQDRLLSSIFLESSSFLLQFALIIHIVASNIIT